jgi:hypothetical protein
MATKTKSKSKKEALKLVNFKTNAKERALLKANAERYANGVVSEWIRLAALRKCSCSRHKKRVA